MVEFGVSGLIDLSNYFPDVIDEESISNGHKKNNEIAEDDFWGIPRSHISVADSCDRLQSPVEGIVEPDIPRIHLA